MPLTSDQTHNQTVNQTRSHSATAASSRYAFIDWLRGFSILLMVIYHLCYDLDLFGYIDTAFGKNYWVPFRYVIVIGFLSLVGVSLVLVHGDKIRWRSMRKRSLQLLLAAIAVSVSSYVVDPRQVTLFGILQLILVASWLALPFIKYANLALLSGVVIFAFGHLVQTPALEPLWIHWIGMVEYKRPALDYVPVFPWLGVVLMGITLGHWFFSNSTGQKLASFQMSELPGLTLFSKGLEKAGQHSLIIYLVHQPMLFGMFYVIELASR